MKNSREHIVMKECYINSSLKRVLDITGVIVLLFVLSPVLFVSSLLIYLRMGRPVIFRHLRSGLNKQPFSLIKLRSMVNDPDNKLSDKERITPLGTAIRKFSIDEIPQLINVLKGEMSLVGPRPLLPEYDSLYSDFQNKRFFAKPGITGWAQVNGRNQLSWDEKLKLDVFYVENWSIWLDIRILFKTVWVVLGSVGFKLSGEDHKFGEKTEVRNR